ncbi:MAG: diadenylate cyclase [Desulfobacterales bacterium]
MDTLSSFIFSIRWQDFLDIAISSYILFRLYVLFRGTNVFRVIAGIALLWFFQRISVTLGLIVTSWAMQGIIALAAIIIIIVFRNEIRSILQAKNLRAILWGFPGGETKTPIEIIVESVYDLSRKGIGALLVFPAKENLEDVLQSGIPLNGLVSKEMITSIFWHDNPVHDGAAVISGDRIVEVGAILPLSHRDDLPSHYGTRHRAAAGLAEATDALAIIVSEERGSVLSAKGSDISEAQSKAELARILQEHVGIAAESSDNNSRKKIEIAVAAAVSVLIVSGLWLSFSRGQETLIELEIPVEYTGRDPKMEIIDTSVNTVRLQIGGSGALIKSAGPEQVKVALDLSNAVVGSNTFTITNDNITLPPGVYLKSVMPSVVDVNLDIPVERELPVQVDWTGKLPRNLIVVEVKVRPEKTRIIGGGGILKNLSTIYTEKVPLDNIKGSGTINANLALNPASLKIASDSKDKVEIEYVVKRRVF